MCGLVGYIKASGAPLNNSSAIIEMLKYQKHRGPDDSGIRVFSFSQQVSRELPNNRAECLEDNGYDGVIGFNRLSILDLSKQGHQPMCSDDGKVILAFNGEIYNAFEYKPELERDGVKFKSKTDTEVVLYLYLKYGFDGLVRRLNGMYAIVVVDLKTGNMYLARDRFGIKPLYLYRSGEIFAFSSEIKSYFGLPSFNAELNYQNLDEYLLFRSVYQGTLLKNITPVEPGCYIVYTKDKGVCAVRYFDVEQYTRNVSNVPSIEDSIAEFYDKLRVSVSRQLISDVKLGCQLSGGIDSSLVTHAARIIKKDDLLESVSIVFKEKKYSEENYIDAVVANSGIRVHKFILDSDYYLRSFEKAAWHYEAPLNHPNTIGVYLLSEMAKKYVTVLLSGEGADEVFGGYDRFYSLSRPYYLQSFILYLKRYRNNPLHYILNYGKTEFRSVIASSFLDLNISRQIRPDFDFDSAVNSRYDCYRSLTGSLFDRQVKYEMKTYLPDLLVRQDSMSMAHSIENRVPFLDNELVDYAFTIPEQYLITKNGNKMETKYLLKKTAALVYGEEFAYRKKMGFGIPLRNYFSDKHFKEWVNDQIVPGLQQRDLLSSKCIVKWIDNISKISVAELEGLWVGICLEIWMQQYKVL